MHGFLIAGTNSGCGKTTVTIGLMALLKSKGYKVAPFKTGPDYIDPLFHSKVLEVPSYNLDSYMLSDPALNHLYTKHALGNDVVITEGVMGMYDGMGDSSIGSSYEVSKKLKLPIILVVSCKSIYQSVAAIVKGFSTLRNDAPVCGVIFNHVPNQSYYEFLKSVVEKECAIPCLGFVPTNPNFALESRHLGLVQAEEVEALSQKIEKLRIALEETIEIEKLLGLTNITIQPNHLFELPDIDLSDLHIGVASDKAFRFYYADNLELLKELGANIHLFSPLKDKHLPEGCNCLYIGGGYPEVFAEELSTNTLMMDAIRNASENGMPIYAECGGLMYLTESIVDLNGAVINMAGIFNTSVQMTKALKRFGYARIHFEGQETRCHEFHRSEIQESDSKPNYTLEFQLKKPEKDRQWRCGLRRNNTLAGYAHIHFYSQFKFFEQIIKLWRQATI